MWLQPMVVVLFLAAISGNPQSPQQMQMLVTLCSDTQRKEERHQEVIFDQHNHSYKAEMFCLWKNPCVCCTLYHQYLHSSEMSPTVKNSDAFGTVQASRNVDAKLHMYMSPEPKYQQLKLSRCEQRSCQVVSGVQFSGVQFC